MLSGFRGLFSRKWVETSWRWFRFLDLQKQSFVEIPNIDAVGRLPIILPRLLTKFSNIWQQVRRCSTWRGSRPGRRAASAWPSASARPPPPPSLGWPWVTNAEFWYKNRRVLWNGNKFRAIYWENRQVPCQQCFVSVENEVPRAFGLALRVTQRTCLAAPKIPTTYIPSLASY